MPEKQGHYQVRYTAGVAIIDLCGTITALSGEVLNRAYETAKSQAPDVLLLHFGGVEYINSGGIGLLLYLLDQERTAGRPVLACGLSEHYAEIFRLIRLADWMCLCPDEAGALAEAERAERPVASRRGAHR